MRLVGKTIFCYWLICTAVMANEDNIKLSAEQISNLGIQLGKPENIQHAPLLYAPAKVIIPPKQEFIISAPQAGLVSKLYLATGENVTKQQLLAQVNSPDLLNLQKQYLQRHHAFNIARSKVERDKKLHQEGIISDRRWQESLAGFNSLKAELNAAGQLLEIAGKSKADIRNLVKNRTLNSELSIVSPINGVVLERMVSSGERIEQYVPLYRIANLDKLWLDIQVPQEKIQYININDQVVIEHTQAAASISLIGQVVNPNNQTVLVRAVITPPHHGIRPGQTLNAKILQKPDKPVYKLPNTAVAQREGQAFIFVRQEHGFRIKPVMVIGKQGNNSIVSANPDLSGQTIAIRGAVTLKANWLGLGSDE